MKRIVSFVATLMCLCPMAVRPAMVAPQASVTSLRSEPLPEYPGKEVQMIVVDYPPRAVDPVHRHDAHAFVYVLDGSIVMGVGRRQGGSSRRAIRSTRALTTSIRSGAQCQFHAAGKIRRVPDQEQGRTDPDPGEVEKPSFAGTGNSWRHDNPPLQPVERFGITGERPAQRRAALPHKLVFHFPNQDESLMKKPALIQRAFLGLSLSAHAAGLPP